MSASVCGHECKYVHEGKATHEHVCKCARIHMDHVQACAQLYACKDLYARVCKFVHKWKDSHV